MVMIRCPECGQRVLDVASSCPHCHRVLIQNPLETHDWTDLIECGRCHKHIDRSARLCPYCGHNVRAARVAMRTVAGAVGVAALIAVSVILVKTGAFADLTRSFRSAPQASAPAPQTPPAVAEQVPDTAAGEAAALDSTPAQPSPPPQVVETTPPPSTASRPTAAETPVQLVTRWTADWANVREGRSIETPAVQVLPPGRAIRVGDRQRGWWVVYADTRPIGYIANSVLTTTPPSDPG